MTSEVPYWVSVLQALLTPTIAFLAVCIAYWQWRIIRQKVTIALFEQRIRIFKDIRRKMPNSMEFDDFNYDNYFELASSIEEAGFVFGDEVVKYLKAQEELVHKIVLCNIVLKREKNDEKILRYKAERQNLMGSIGNFTIEFRNMIMPYVKMDQKLSRSWSSRMQSRWPR